MAEDGSRYLHSSILERVEQSERDGGVVLEDLPRGQRVEIQTKHTLYVVSRCAIGHLYIEGSEKYCPTPVRCQIHGSTWGTPMIKVGFIGVGMHMEYSTDEHRGTILTSTILSATVKDA